jgi:hypothetical protein
MCGPEKKATYRLRRNVSETSLCIKHLPCGCLSFLTCVTASTFVPGLQNFKFFHLQSFGISMKMESSSLLLLPVSSSLSMCHNGIAGAVKSRWMPPSKGASPHYRFNSNSPWPSNGNVITHSESQQQQQQQQHPIKAAQV